MLSASLGAQEPDFDEFIMLIDSALEQTGQASHAGERTELVRYAADGWEILISAAWDGSQWRLLALRLHHPERIDAPDQRWAEHYQALLEALDPEQIQEIEPPELFEVPPPTFLPALPEELRARQFDIDHFWYQASWFNDGGFNEDARWALRSFELVARPPQPTPQ
ncbi:MAG: hypothetical protein V2J42_05290 [Wenzhouxiangella sp.]|jgi:hypothetical protein|nr:hypothetical protein [Wenzhouxiangella sp.]